MARNIIIVDNQAFFRDITRKLISNFPNTKIIGEAGSANELMDLMGNGIIPEIIFTEVDLPNVNGVELTKKVLKKYKSIVIIGLSLKNRPEIVNDFMDAGAKGYLLKLSNNKPVLRDIFDNPLSHFFYSTGAKKTVKKGGKQTILVVDDFETNTYVIGLTLQNAKFKVLKAANGIEGLRMAKNTENNINLIVADYNMPDMNGVEMIRQIRQLPKYRKVPALILSSDNSDEKKKNAERVGISAWIQKPYKIEHFLKIVQMALK